MQSDKCSDLNRKLYARYISPLDLKIKLNTALSSAFPFYRRGLLLPLMFDNCYKHHL